MTTLLGILFGLAALVLLVVLHELGHAWQARRCGVVVEEFGIGLPPTAWHKKLKNGIIFSINWLMLGGFVKLQGEYDEATGKGDYGAATFWQKTRILFAGVIANTLTAVVIITSLALIGLPKIIDNQFTIKSDSQIILKSVEIVSVESGSAAENAGIKSGDKIIKFANQDVKTNAQFSALIATYKGKKVGITYSRDDVVHNTQALLGTNATVGYLGVGMGQREYIRSTWSAPVVGVVTTAQFTWETAKGVGVLMSNLISSSVLRFNTNANIRSEAVAKLKAAGDSVTGPVGIVGTIFPAAEQAGLVQMALLTAIISISLAVMNVLPIPTLDGGRWFTMVIFKLFKKKLTMAREEKIQTVGFFVIIGLAILVTFLDVKKIL